MKKRPPAAKVKTFLSDNFLASITVAVALFAAIIFDKYSPPHKWHAAIMWSTVALFGVLVWGREKRDSWVFWMYWTACSLLHIFAMWVIFGHLLPRLILGTLYVVPLAFVESLSLFIVFVRLERKFAQQHASG
jgi:hypothetical protein